MLFWVAMALIVGGSIAITFTIAAREYEAPELQRRPSVAIQASEVLARGGIGALKDWLEREQEFHRGPRSVHHRSGRRGHPGPAPVRRRGAAPGILQSRRSRRSRYARRSRSPASLATPAVAAASRQFPPQPRRAADRRRRRHGLHRAARAAAPQHLRRAQPAGNIADHSLHCPGGERADQLVAGAAPERAHSAHPGRRARARLRESRRARERGTARQRRTRGAQGRSSRFWHGISTPWRISCGPIAAPSRSCCATSPTSCARRWRRMRVALGLARQPPADLSRQLDRLEREIERLDSLISQVLKLARLHGTDAPFAREAFDLDEVIEEVVRDANFEGAVKNCRVRLRGAAQCRGQRQPRPAAKRHRERAAQRRALQPAGCARRGLGRAHRRGCRDSHSRSAAPGFPTETWSAYSSPSIGSPNPATATTGGEGIGLAITAQVMKAHGGSAKAANRQGGGFEVRLSLPADALAV